MFILLFFIKLSLKKTDKLIENLINEDQSKLHFYRLNSDFNSKHPPNFGYFHFDKGRIFIKFFDVKDRCDRVHLLATPTKPHVQNINWYISFKDMKENAILEEIELKDILKLEPHWNMEFYDLLHKYQMYI